MSNTFVRVLTSVNTKQKKVNNFILHIFAKNLQVLSKNVQNKIDVGSYQHQFIYNIVHIHFCYNCLYLHGYCSFQFDYFNIFFLSPPIASDSLSSPFSLSSLIQFPLFPYSLPSLSSLESSKRIDTNYQILQTHSKSRSQTHRTHMNHNPNCERRRGIR